MKGKKPGLILLGLVAIGFWIVRPTNQIRAGQQGQAPKARSGAMTLVFDLVDGTSQSDIEAFEKKYGVDLTYSSPTSEDEALLRAEVSNAAQMLAKVKGDPLVEVVEPVVQMKAFGYPNDPQFEAQWSMRMIGAAAGWSAGAGRGIDVAVIDTGVSQVEDLKGTHIKGGGSYVPGVKSPEDDNGHGTHVSGTIAQTTHNGKGVVGIAPKATIMPYKVLSARGGGASDWIAAAIDDAVDNGADVINLSLGGPHSDVMYNAVERAAAAGVVVAVAAGNSGREGVGCPANAPNVIGVSAVGPGGRLAPYSTWGKGVEIAAPGGDTKQKGGGILQDTIDGKGGHAYLAFQGTSMATPHVAGAAAVLLGMGVDGDTAVDAILSTARGKETGSGYGTKYGYGVLDLEAAVSRIAWRHNGARFALGGMLALALVLLLGLKSQVPVVVGTAALAAGGVFFLPTLGMAPNLIFEVLGRDLLGWGALIDPGVYNSAIWASALIPVGVAFVFGLMKPTAGLSAGVCIGIGTALLFGAFGGTIDPWRSGPAWLDTAWLLGNGLVSVGAGLAVLGALKMGYSAAS